MVFDKETYSKKKAELQSYIDSFAQGVVEGLINTHANASVKELYRATNELLRQEDLPREVRMKVRSGIDQFVYDLKLPAPSEGEQVERTLDSRYVTGITICLSNDKLRPLYDQINIAKEIIDFSNEKGWSKEQLQLASKIISSFEHLS